MKTTGKTVDGIGDVGGCVDDCVVKVIFLDIDGVLVNREMLMKQSERHASGHPDCVAALNKIVEATQAKIVISSVWRAMGVQKMRALLRDWGVKASVIDCTPQLDSFANVDSFANGLWVSVQRGQEIQAWLDKNKAEAFVIIDDDSDMVHLKDKLVQTKFETGLTMSDAEKAIGMLQ